jgi:hypothetical protein
MRRTRALVSVLSPRKISLKVCDNMIESWVEHLQRIFKAARVGLKIRYSQTDSLQAPLLHSTAGK